MNRRIIKQIIYGSFYLVIIFLIGSGIYWIFSSKASCFDSRQNQGEEGIDCGGPCVSCAIKESKPISVSWTRVFPVADNKVLAIAEISNPNPETGGEFSYSFAVFSKEGNILQTVNNTSFIYAGEPSKYLIDPVNLDLTQIDKTEITFSDIDWQMKDVFSKPRVIVREFKTDISSASASNVFPVSVSGVVVNNDAMTTSKNVLVALLRGQNGLIIGISKTELENLAPTESKNFRILFQSNINAKDINPGATEVYVYAKRQ